MFIYRAKIHRKLRKYTQSMHREALSRLSGHSLCPNSVQLKASEDNFGIETTCKSEIASTPAPMSHFFSIPSTKVVGPRLLVSGAPPISTLISPQPLPLFETVSISHTSRYCLATDIHAHKRFEISNSVELALPSHCLRVAGAVNIAGINTSARYAVRSNSSEDSEEAGNDSLTGTFTWV
jgi:hypothetical protein